MRLRKLFSVVLAAALCLGLFSVPAQAEEDEIIFHGIGFVTMPCQCLYSKASSDSEVLAVTGENDCVVVVSDQEDSW